MVDASNERHVKLLEKQARQAARDRADFIRHSMQTRSGRAYFCEKLEQSHIFQSSIVAGAVDPYKVMFNEGERNIGLMILGDIMAFCPEQYVTMMQERNARDTLTDSRLRASDEDADRRNRNGDASDRDANFVDYDELPDTAKQSDYEPTDATEN